MSTKSKNKGMGTSTDELLLQGRCLWANPLTFLNEKISPAASRRPDGGCSPFPFLVVGRLFGAMVLGWLGLTETKSATSAFGFPEVLSVRTTVFLASTLLTGPLS
ncbi:hypothetical protein MTP99_003685 [Tenebrio molitor]|nr:hypothetical protein MTP99_003685 [Tenebrio molitor]